MVINQLPDVEIVAADTLSDTVRGEGGFGSTGKK
jgi:dUTPase